MLDIQNKIEFENNLWIGTVDASNFNSSEDARIKAVTDLASITKGKLGFKETCDDCHNRSEPYNCEGESATCHEFTQSLYNNRRLTLYNKLLTESAGKSSVPFEFIPISIECKQFYDICNLTYSLGFITRHNELLKYMTLIHSYKDYAMDDCKNIVGNYRGLLNIFLDIDIEYNKPEEVKDFKIIVGKVPYEVIKYLGRKSAFSLICELDNADEENYERYLEEVEFWYPSWWEVGTVDLFKEKNDVLRVGYLKGQITHPPLMKPGEAIMELSDRRLVKFAMCAWKKDSNAWDNLFTRNDITSPIVKLAVDNIKKLIV